MEQMEKYWDRFVGWLPSFGVALLIFVAFAITATIVRKSLKNNLVRFIHQKSVVNLIARMAHISLLLIGALFALKQLNLDGVVTSVLAGAGIIGLALGFAFQDIASNFISGIIMAIQKQFNIGDIVEVGDTFGTVKKIELRTTTLQTPDGKVVLIPNKDVYMSQIVDYSTLGMRRVDLACGVGYSDDLDKAQNLALEAVRQVDGLVESKPVDFYYNEFKDSSINFVVRYWVSYKKQPDFLEARSQGIKLIKAKFDENNIDIPFPIRTIDFGPKGSDGSLSQHL